MTSGVYRISCAASEKVYIGSAAKIAVRWRAHLGMLRRGEHHSIHLQRSWAKHGESAFRFDVIEECAPENLTTLEQKWIDHYGRPRLYNMRLKAESQLGYRHREETKAKMRGRIISEETRAKMRETMRKRVADPEVRARMAAILAPHTERGRALALQAVKEHGPYNVGRKLTPEHRAALSRGHAGKPRPWRRGLKHSEETRRKLSIARRKRITSDATRAKMSATHKIIWAARRAAA